MTYDELLALLEERGWPTFPAGPDQFRTFCPVCEGDGSNSPSFSVGRGDDGSALLYCFSGRGGCGLDAGPGRTAEAVADALEAFRGMPAPRGAARRWRSRNPGSRSPEAAGAVEVERYEYEGGSKVRYEWPDGWRKDFRWRPRKPARALLYRPPTNPARWVFLVEGERDVESLEAIGMQATTPSEGHLSVTLARKLRGFRVAVLRDYDEHGLRARDAALASLAAAGVEAIAVELPGLEQRESRGEDVTDWIANGGTADELKAMVELAAYGPASAAPAPAAGGWDDVGWRFHGGKMQERRGTTWRDTSVGFQISPEEALVDEEGQVRAYVVRLAGAAVTLPSSFMGSQNRSGAISSAGGPDLMPEDATVVGRFLSAARDSGRLPRREVLTRAEWTRDGRLRIPGALEPSPGLTELAAYGSVGSTGSEEAARAAWAEIAREAAAAPKLALALGFPLGALHVTLLADPQIFTLHITGESHTGKSESAEMAMQQLGDARRGVGALYRNWNMSDKAPGNVLKQVGVLPVWFDEAANDERDPEAFTHMLFNLMDGRERRIAGTDGRNVAGGATWTACVLSTGEARLTIKSGLTGFRRRVMELYAPLQEDEQLHTRLIDIARAYHGWPARWAVADPDPAGFRARHRRLFLEAADIARGQQVEVAQAHNVATCAAGLGELARLAGADVPEHELRDAALAVFEKLMRSGEEEGADVGERGLRAVAEAVRTSGRFPAADDLDIETGRQRWGAVLEPGVVGIFGDSALREILREYAGIGDSQPVLVKWDDTGRLERDGRKGFGTRRTVFDPVHGRRRQVPMYVVRLGPLPD